MIAPAYSMLDEKAAPVEVTTSRVPEGQDWTAPVDRRAMHFRFYSPESGSPSLYASQYATELARRAAFVQNLPFPTGARTEQASRANGLWVTEGYVVEGDAPAPRAESWRAVLQKVKAGIPNVRVFIAFTFYPTGDLAGPALKGWDIPFDAPTPVVNP
ncbi:hypothetical protein EON77_19445 [bacterium]|nr:MAG: hypothetical protein EON77_19445 [bacterium]